MNKPNNNKEKDSSRSEKPVVLDIVDEKVSFKPVGEDVGSLGLPGKRSVLDLDENRASLDAYFEGPNNILHKILIQKNLKAMKQMQKLFHIQCFQHMLKGLSSQQRRKLMTPLNMQQRIMLKLL